MGVREYDRVLEYDRLEILDYLKRSVRHMQQIASNNPGGFGQMLLAVANEIAGDTAALEVELIEAGYLPRPANEA